MRSHRGSSLGLARVLERRHRRHVRVRGARVHVVQRAHVCDHARRVRPPVGGANKRGVDGEAQARVDRARARRPLARQRGARVLARDVLGVRRRRERHVLSTLKSFQRQILGKRQVTKAIKVNPNALERAIAVPAEVSSAIMPMLSTPKGATPIHAAKTPITRDRNLGADSFNTRVDCIAPKAAIPVPAPNKTSKAAP